MRWENRAIILFLSIHDVMAARRRLEVAEVRHELVPVPKELSSECGMAIAIYRTDITKVEALIEECGTCHTGIYQHSSEGFEVAEP